MQSISSFFNTVKTDVRTSLKSNRRKSADSLWRNTNDLLPAEADDKAASIVEKREVPGKVGGALSIAGPSVLYGSSFPAIASATRPIRSSVSRLLMPWRPAPRSCPRPGPSSTFAARAMAPVRPDTRLESFPSRFLVRKHVGRLHQDYAVAVRFSRCFIHDLVYLI